MNEFLTDRKYRYIAMYAAKQLGYGDAVIQKIRADKNNSEVEESWLQHERNYRMRIFERSKYAA